MNRSRARLFAVSGLVFLAASGIYGIAFVGVSLTYFALLLLHVAVGGLVVIPLVLWAVQAVRERATAPLVTLSASLLAIAASLAGAGVGLYIAVAGLRHSNQGIAALHTTVSAAGFGLVLGALLIGRRSGTKHPALALLVCAGLATAAPFAYRAARAWGTPRPVATHNPPTPPMTMDGESMGGKDGPFAPSSVSTSTGGKIPAEYLTRSEESCSRCHKEIFEQWKSSSHHFSSFNNPWYTKSIEYMQDVKGIRPSKWCAGCHDVAPLLSGMMDRPVREIENTEAGQAGLGCIACHGITQVKSTMGQGDYLLELPELHALAESKNPLLRAAHDYVVHVNPEAHRRLFLKPLHRSEKAAGAEFCVACHKVHLDVPVNGYRWLRGFNEYDSWQASGVSGQGARSFYYPPQSNSCGGCHMPLEPSNEAGNRNGMIHSHRFPAANTALATMNHDEKQLGEQIAFLKGCVSVDIFGVARDGEAAGPAPVAVTRRGSDGPPAKLASTFAVGEEGGSGSATVFSGPLREIAAATDGPLSLKPGESALIEVVVRNRRTGHFFPGGTVDAPDVWLELKVTDARGAVVFWSGRAADDGRGPVDPGAHFYKSSMLDGHGNPINKRNAWSARSAMYVHLIPPGSTDTAHFRVTVPPDAVGPLHAEARMNYRKFQWWNTQFTFRGVLDPHQAGKAWGPDFDDRSWAFDATKPAVEVPTIVVASAEAQLPLAGVQAAPAAPAAAAKAGAPPSERWNDYGIGLFLQGDLRNAAHAFARVRELAPGYADGWVNSARVLVDEGNGKAALDLLDKALALKPDLPKAFYLEGVALKQQGRYPEAAEKLAAAAAAYPRDRVVLNELGRVLYLQKKFEAAAAQGVKVVEIDPEDLNAHYLLTLCYQAMGNRELAEREQKLYARFKADETSQALTGEARRADADSNNERQPIHEHASVALNGPPARPQP
ncbi:MAG TPA: tetratricopeptide repeat protein [Myxococcales bacterium]